MSVCCSICAGRGRLTFNRTVGAWFCSDTVACNYAARLRLGMHPGQCAGLRPKEIAARKAARNAA